MLHPAHVTAALATAGTLLVLGGCTGSGGSDDVTDDAAGPSSAPSSTATPVSPLSPATTEAPSGPDCADVWTAGATLPDDYESCVADGRAAPQDVVACTDGSSLVVYADSLYAVTGQEIHEPADAPLQDTEEFGRAYGSCTG